MLLLAGGAGGLRSNKSLTTCPVDLCVEGVGEGGKNGICQFWDDHSDDEAVVIGKHAGAFVAKFVDRCENSVSSVVRNLSDSVKYARNGSDGNTGM